jgi:hypothetical protein
MIVPMKNVIAISGCFLMMIALLLFSVRVMPQHIHDGFESTRLNSFRWSTRRFVSGAVQSEATVVHSGVGHWQSQCGMGTGTRLQTKVALRLSGTS